MSLCRSSTIGVIRRNKKASSLYVFLQSLLKGNFGHCSGV